jgi:lysophospholipase L1-like esterase
VTRRQAEAARTAAACIGILALGVAFVVLASAGCGPIGPDEILTRALPGATAIQGRDEPGYSGSPFKPALKVMVVGDSTSAGNWGGVSYRQPLLAALNERPDLQTVTFVGTQSAIAPCCYDAFPGASTAVVMGRLPNDIAATRPDVLVIHLGTNDQDPSVVTPYMAGVDAALAAADLKIIAAPVIYWASDDARRRAMNAALVPALKAHSAYGTRLFVAEEMADALAPGVDFDQPPGTVANDGIHPGVAGNEKMAAVWHATGAGILWPPRTVQ